MAWVIVARDRDDELLQMGAFLIDAWCLGVKDAWFEELTRPEFDELLNEQIPAPDREAIAPTDAKTLIEGAAAFAQSLGFLPHRDFRKARKVLSGIKAEVPARAFAFGHEGRVHFVAGPADDDTRVRRVLAVLDAKFGPEGFDFTPYADPDEEDDGVDWAAMDMMFRFFESPHGPDPAINGFFVSGFVGAAVMLETADDTEFWWRILCGGDLPALPDDGEFSAETIRRGFIEEWLDSEHEFELGRFEPAMPKLNETEGDHFVVAADHCRGFIRALEARPELVARLEQDQAAAEAVASLQRLAGAGQEGPSGIARRSAVPVIGAAQQVIWTATRAWREPPSGT